jgi:hypothetical protein
MYGPRYALTKSTVLGASFMLMIGFTLYWMNYNYKYDHEYKYKYDHEFKYNHGMNVFSELKSISKYLLFALFVYQSANVQFLYTQHWSFIGSVLSPDEVATSGTLIAGIGSITSTFAAGYVSTLVERIGLIGSQCTAAIIIGSSAIFADKAYQIASKYGFQPEHGLKKKKEKVETEVESSKIIKGHSVKSSSSSTATATTATTSSTSSTSTSTSSSTNNEENVLKTALKLFKRVPILGAMFCEVLIAQCLSSLLNFQFMTEVKNTILNDDERAGFTGNCYAWVNGVSGALQFFILPFVVKKIGARWMWLMMPIIMLILTSLQFSQHNPSLALVGLTFLTLKTIEYSLRGQASEMVWVMLDYESRFIGKELINLFANRLGKSGTAVILALLTVRLEKDGMNLRSFIVNTSIFLAFIWLICTIRVTRLIPTKRTMA